MMAVQMKKIFGLDNYLLTTKFAENVGNGSYDNSWDRPPWVTDSVQNTTDFSNFTETTSSPENSMYTTLLTYSHYRTARNIGLYSNIILVLLGTIGNFFSFLIMTRKSMIKSSTCYYMAALSIADTLVLYCACLRSWIAYITGSDVINSSSTACKMISFFCYWSFSMAAWILVAMTIDRYIVIHYPLKANKYSTIKRTQKVIILLAFLLAGFTMHYLFTVTKSESGRCQAIKEHKKDFLELIWPWLDATVYCFIPFVTLIIFNSLIIYDHHKAIRRRSSLQPSLNKSRHINGLKLYKVYNNRKLTVMLLVVSVSFLITSSPKTILVIIRPYIFDVMEEAEDIDFNFLANYSLTTAIADVFMYTNHSLNFILYCLSGQKFRDELCRFLKLCIYSRKHRRVSTASAISQNIRRNSAVVNIDYNNTTDCVVSNIEGTKL